MDVLDVPVGEDRFAGGTPVEVRAPYDGRLLGRVPVCGDGEVGTAVATARERLAGGVLPPWRRAEILERAARLLAERTEELARTIALEAAKPIRSARVEARRAASTFTFAAVEARRLAGEVVPLEASEVGEGKLGFTLRVPVGVVGAITPFNFPLNLVAHKVAPAIAAGCPVVVKPAEQTPLSAIALGDLLLRECGLPAGWLSVVTGPGEVTGAALVAHPGIAMITFTGSAEVGWSIRARAPRARVSLELGNSTPVIVEPDADLDRAARAVAASGFGHAGQSCISVQRVYVHRSVAEDFTGRLVPLVEDLRLGDPLEEHTDVSALIAPSARDRVQRWIEEAIDAGAKVLTGGVVRDGLLAPTVLSEVTPDMRVCAQEVFGPVVGIQAYDTFEEALALADGTSYGLQAGVFTSDIGKALRAARELHFGGVLVNETPTWRADQMPYGGVRDSGNTREGPAWAVQEMTEPRLVVIQP